MLMKHCLLILLAACLCLTSCSTLDMLAVDTLMPADVSFAPDVKRMAVLDTGRSPIYDDMDLPTVRGIGTYKIH